MAFVALFNNTVIFCFFIAELQSEELQDDKDDGENDDKDDDHKSAPIIFPWENLSSFERLILVCTIKYLNIFTFIYFWSELKTARWTSCLQLIEIPD